MTEDQDLTGLLDHIEDVIGESPRIPLTAKVIVDEDELLDTLDQVRASLPVEIQEAKWISKERERLITEARQEAERIIEEARIQAERIVTEAQQTAERLVDQNTITQKAEEKSNEILEHAKTLAQDMHRSAKEYAIDVLLRLERHIERALTTVRQSRTDLAGIYEPEIKAESKAEGKESVAGLAQTTRSQTVERVDTQRDRDRSPRRDTRPEGRLSRM
ncbi:MAG TPA: hypothetical protein GX507_06815 [Clostridia bacterium]|nr:hypothetical protein [Clostridia bacterium]